ncbi:MAG TPA: glycosyltransferase [Pyrinomonadaceae bacterium]|nr:glycosyltransferase [Pyrinomonadaceae bacterium]
MFTNLLYVGDVPVEASYHGSALLHRLLSGHPHEKLTIIETATESEPKRRLPNVNYIAHPIGKPRWLNTRFHPYAVAWFSHAGMRIGPKIDQSLNGFRVESILTVAHGFGWLAAARIANERRVPLHLMIHDDWPRAADIAPVFRNWLDARFADVYRQAQSRLCVSPAMSRFYQERYGKPAQVIYPSRAADCPVYNDPPGRLSRDDKPFTIAFAGTINSNGYIHALRALEKALKPIGGRLLIFGPLKPDTAREVGFADEHTEVCGLLSWSELMARLRDEADALFVPMSFESSHRANMETAFPSKLADCTATGLPLLIYGPSYCSAVTWASENQGVAEVVEAESDLGEAIQRLANDPRYRVSLGKRALDVGREYFTHHRVQQVFSAALCETSVTSAFKETETAEGRREA